MDVISLLSKTNARIVKFLRLYSRMDTPAKARKDPAEAEAGLATSTGKRQACHYTIDSDPFMIIILDGTDELYYLQKIMNAKTRVARDERRHTGRNNHTAAPSQDQTDR